MRHRPQCCQRAVKCAWKVLTKEEYHYAQIVLGFVETVLRGHVSGRCQSDVFIHSCGRRKHIFAQVGIHMRTLVSIHIDKSNKSNYKIGAAIFYIQSVIFHCWYFFLKTTSKENLRFKMGKFFWGIFIYLALICYICIFLSSCITNISGYLVYLSLSLAHYNRPKEYCQNYVARSVNS